MKLQYVLFLAKKVLLIKKRKNICIYDIINIILVILKIYNKNGGRRKDAASDRKESKEMFSNSGTRQEKNFLHLEKNGLNIKFTLLIQAISSKKNRRTA